MKIYSASISIKKFCILDMKKLIFRILNILFIHFIKYFHMFCIFIIDKHFIYISIYKYKYKIKKKLFSYSCLSFEYFIVLIL